ncbi:MAG: DUF192 domain-containing protein [Candidatus Omnitrophica bacterium]|nr:DUF192 domain-containing protein [Candidatus Omnitrophota bacterium]
MRLINHTKGVVLAEDIFVARSFFSKIKGLIGRKLLLPGQGIILEPCNSIHTFFMRFPIDVLFVNRKYRVIKAIPDFYPNKISLIYWRSARVIELPAGTIKSTDTQLQDYLEISG